MIRIIQLGAVCIPLALSIGARAASIAVSESFPAALHLTGEIQTGDLRSLQYGFHRIRDRRFVTLYLNSAGGSLEEAISIGRWVRQQKITTALSERFPAECFSSCVFILAGGVARVVVDFPHHKVGIHRPYFTRMPNQTIEIAMRRALADSRAYFAEMNIPEQLADAMFSIPPDKIQILSKENLSFYRLNQTDMVHQEETDMRNAARYGMSREEYMRRWSLFEAEIKQTCLNPNQDRRFIEMCLENAQKKYGFHETQAKSRR